MAPSRYGLPAVSSIERGVWDGQGGMKLELSIKCSSLTAPSRYGLPAVSSIERGGGGRAVGNETRIKYKV